MKNERLAVAIGFVVVVTIWSTTWLVIKIGLNSVPPIFGVAMRFTLGSVILFAIMRLRGERLVLNRSAAYLFFALGMFSFSIPFVLIYWGELTVATGLSAILFAAYPFSVAIASQIILHDEKLTVYKSVGILLGLAGLIVIFWSDLVFGGPNIPAMCGILLSAIVQGTMLVVVKRFGEGISSFALNLGGMVSSIVVLYALAFTFEDFSTVRFDAGGIFSILYLGTFGTVIAFVVYYWLLKRVEAIYLSLISFITPVFAVVLGALILKERLSPNIFSGATLVLFGILFSNGKDLRRVLEKKFGGSPR